MLQIFPSSLQKIFKFYVPYIVICFGIIKIYFRFKILEHVLLKQNVLKISPADQIFVLSFFSSIGTTIILFFARTPFMQLLFEVKTSLSMHYYSRAVN
jgi:hypothetical protein